MKHIKDLMCENINDAYDDSEMVIVEIRISTI